MKKLQNEKLKQQFIRSSDYLEQFSFDVSLDTQLFFLSGQQLHRQGRSPTYAFILLSEGQSQIIRHLSQWESRSD
ncbi:MAG: hypothetical protein ACLUSM_20245 [Enterococcus avium]